MNSTVAISPVPLNPLCWNSSQKRNAHRLLGFSALVLFFEVALIRFIPAQVQIVSYFINLILIAAFLGIGVGLLMQSRGLKALEWCAPALLLLVAVSGYFSNTVVQIPVLGDEFFYSVRLKVSPSSLKWGMVTVVTIIFGLSTLVFIPLGSGIGKHFGHFPPLIAYSINIFGSLLGLVVFSLLSHLSTPPVIWFLVGILYYIFLSWEDQNIWISSLSMFAIIFLVHGMAQKEGELWSPYYKINYFKSPNKIDVSVNGSFHQSILNLALDPSAKNTFVQLVREDYLSPYQFVKSKDEVLILGAGTGNDVALALEQGAGHIDAVEIDGQIYTVEKEYADPDVDIFKSTKNDDGTIDFEVKYYNGGCCFNEAIDAALSDE